MNFGDILDTWEKQQDKKTKKSIMEKILDEYPLAARDYREKTEQDADYNSKALKRKQLLAMHPQKEIDLHGYTAQKAIEQLAAFIKVCKNENLKKILIIHGKGNHSASGPVLQKKILEYIQQCPLTGEYGFAHKTMGGRGAMWVILR